MVDKKSNEFSEIYKINNPLHRSDLKFLAKSQFFKTDFREILGKIVCETLVRLETLTLAKLETLGNFKV